MQTLELVSHLTTTNIYVQRQIVRDNIARCKNFKSDPNYQKLPWDLRRDTQKRMDAQVVLVVKLDKKIASMEQTSFGFGGISTTH